jgi:preprotein translocase subunit YajC
MIAVLLADEAAGGSTAPPGGAGGAAKDPFGGLLIPMMLVMLVGFFLLRPRTNRQLQDALAKLKPGDRVVTSSGLVGTVAKVVKEGDQDLVTLRFEDGNARVQLFKYAITQVLADPKDAPKDKDAPAGK